MLLKTLSRTISCNIMHMVNKAILMHTDQFVDRCTEKDVCHHRG